MKTSTLTKYRLRRKKAFKWWKSLSNEDKLKKCTNIKRNPETITGPIIIELYKKRIKNWNRMDSIINPFI